MKIHLHSIISLKFVIISISILFFAAGVNFAGCNSCGIIKDGNCPLECAELLKGAKKEIKKELVKPKPDKKRNKKIKEKDAGPGSGKKS